MESHADPYSQRFSELNWMGYQWYIKDTHESKCGPGPNLFNKSNVKIDSEGNLLLSIKNINQEWVCSEIITKECFHFGDFQWTVQGNLHNLDKNIVFGIFLYPPSPEVAPDGTNQIDIEFARWGHDKPGNLDYTLFTASELKQKPMNKCQVFSKQMTNKSSHKITWRSTSIINSSQYEYPFEKIIPLEEYKFPAEVYQIPKIKLRCHMNLWLFKGNSPSNNQQVTIKINSFKYNSV